MSSHGRKFQKNSLQGFGFLGLTVLIFGLTTVRAETPSASDSTQVSQVKVMARNGSAVSESSEMKDLKADNTGINKRDRLENKLTAEHQAQASRQDEEITRQIREELVKNEKLSTYGQNVKIITISGIVTLRGPVKNQQERDIIVRSAQKVSGVKTIQNELEVSE